MGAGGDSRPVSPIRPPAADELRLIPLGGLGEIGMNCLALEAEGRVLLVDCGVTFPSDDAGVDVLHPRFDYVTARPQDVLGVVITHGHEDHIGALPYLLDELDVPVFAPPHALELIRARLAEHGFPASSVRLETVRVNERFDLGPFGVEPLRVTHSIADATALAIRTPAGLVMHTGDFKLDEAPADGELTDVRRLEELGDEGVRLLLSDSTNVDSPGTGATESSVGLALEQVVAAAPERVVVGMFASNVQRLILLGAIARRTRRRICLVGRSVVNHVAAATAVGRLAWPSDLVVPPEMAASMARRDVLVIASGTQAEPHAALSRLASGNYPKLRLDPGDTVVFSSRIIPGHDRQVFDLYAALLRAGADVVTRTTCAGIHASGHAHRGELERMIELTRPRSFVPVHGTLHHLRRHAELARDMGVADVHVAENGDVVALGRDAPLETVGRVASGRVAAASGSVIAEEVLRERKQLGRSGVVAVSVALHGGRLSSSPEVRAYGVVAPLDKDALHDATKAATRAAEAQLAAPRLDPAAFEEAVRVAVRRAVDAHTAGRPIVLVSIHHG